ncbi:MAG: alpha/beta fold hydrolase [Thermodesulfobacteriota bacterium]
MSKEPLAQYPWSPKFLEIGGQRLAYLDEGEGEALVMVHGNPSWSYLYRRLVRQFSKKYRVIVPDHMGCGHSDKPQDYPYRLANHIDNLTKLLDHCQVQRCVLVVHDWGGAIGCGWAGRFPERVKGLVVLNTAAFRSQRIPLRIRICRWPIIGPLLVRGLNAFAGAAIHMAVGGKMAPEVARSFVAPYNSWRNRIATLRFVEDIPLKPTHPSYATLTAVEEGLENLTGKPMLICWGGRDFCFNDHFYAEWRRRFPAAERHYFPEAGHYVLEDAGEEIEPLMADFCGQWLP